MPQTATKPSGCPPRTESQLAQLSDDELIDHIRCSSRHGRHAEARTALQILVFGHRENVRRRVALRVPPEWVDHVTDAALMKAFEASFDGTSKGEFVNWLSTITKRQIADHFRRGEGSRPKHGHLGALEDGGEPEPGAPDETGMVELRTLAEEALEALRPDHALVVERRLRGFSAVEACEGIAGMTADNVNQILRRFRMDLEQRLEAGR